MNIVGTTLQCSEKTFICAFAGINNIIINVPCVGYTSLVVSSSTDLTRSMGYRWSARRRRVSSHRWSSDASSWTGSGCTGRGRAVALGPRLLQTHMSWCRCSPADCWCSTRWRSIQDSLKTCKFTHLATIAYIKWNFYPWAVYCDRPTHRHSHRTGCTGPDPTNFWDSNMGPPKIL